MTQENKELLLKDLCARLPYGVFVKDGNRSTPVKCDFECHPNLYDLENIKPYLRPMSSMTKEEEKELKKIHHQFDKGNFIDAGVFSADDCGCTVIEMSNILYYLISHHFDYRGLIPMGLALEAKEGMYNTKEK